MQKILILTFFLFRLLSSNAQIIKGIVYDNDKNPIPFASVYVVDKIGVMCDEKGFFIINSDKISESDTVIISSVGFKTLTFKKADFINQSAIYLSPIYKNLKPIEIKSDKNKGYTIGKDNIGAMTLLFNDLYKSVLHGSNYPEFGQLLKIKKKSLIENVSFYLKRNTYDTLTLRLKIYSIKDAMPDKILNETDIYKTLYHSKTGWISFDNVNLVYEEDVICAFEILKCSKEENAYIGLSCLPEIFTKNAYFKGSLSGRWRKAKIRFSLFANIIPLL